MSRPPTFGEQKRSASPKKLRATAVVLPQTVQASSSTLSVLNSMGELPNYGGASAKQPKKEEQGWEVSGEAYPRLPPHQTNPTEVLYSELQFQQQIERRRLREKIRELEEILAQQMQLEKEIESMTTTAMSVETRLQAFSAHEMATCSQLLEEIHDWPDDPASLSVRDSLIEIQTTLFEFIGYPGEISKWCGAVSHAIGLLHHNAYVIAKAAPFYDILSTTRGDLRFESNGTKSKIGSFRVPANGFRSILKVLEVYLGKLLKKVEKNIAEAKKGKASFKIGEGLGTIVNLITTFNDVTSYCIQVIEATAPLEIFPLAGCDPVLDEISSLNFDVFYGKLFGLQYSPGMRHIFMGLLLAMVSFGRNFKGDSPELFNKAKALFSSPMSLIDTSSGSVRDLFCQPDIQFLRSFWNLQETCAVVGVDTAIRTKTPDVNFIFHLATTPLLVPMVDGNELVKIGPGLSLVDDTPGSVMDAEMQSVQVRLISFTGISGQITHQKDLEKKRKKPQNKEKDREREESSISFAPKAKEAKDNLILHFHGGGFVAQTSKAHLSYLRDYGSSLDVPILSVDYSLAPDHPYPRALHECFYTYCWALSNPSLIGWNGNRVILTGDSAGGNLAIAVTMLAISNEVRVPDFLFPLYPALLALPVPTPSRLLSVMDPLLGTGILMKCLESYMGEGSGFDPFMSPSLCPVEILRKFPPTFIQTGELDPLLDDSIDFVHKLRRIRTVEAEVKVVSFELSPEIHFSKKFVPLVVVQKNGSNIGATEPWKEGSPALWRETFKVKNWEYGEKITLKVINSAFSKKEKKGKTRKMARSTPISSPRSATPPSSIPHSRSNPTSLGSSPPNFLTLPVSGGFSASTSSPRSPRSPRSKSKPLSNSSSGKAKPVLKPSLCVGSLDLPLPSANDRISKRYTLSSELGSIDIKTAILQAGDQKNICMEIGAIQFNQKISTKTLIYVDVGGREKTSPKTAGEWQAMLERTRLGACSTTEKIIFFEREGKEGVPVALTNVPQSTQVIRVKILSTSELGEDTLVGEAMVPLPMPSDSKRDKIHKTNFVNYSFGRKIGDLEIEIHPIFLRSEKEVYFECKAGMPHGYLGFNRVEAECTKSTQSAIKVLKFACGMGPTPVDGLHSCFSVNDQEESLHDSQLNLSQFHEQLGHRGTIHLGKQGVKRPELKKNEYFSDWALQAIVVDNTGFCHRVPIGALVGVDQTASISSEFIDISFGDAHVPNFPQKFLAPPSMDEKDDISLYESIVLHVEKEGEGEERGRVGGGALGKKNATRQSWTVLPPSMSAIVKSQGAPPQTDKSKGPPTFELKICFVGFETSGRREVFLACALKRPIHNCAYYDPKISSVRGFEELVERKYVKYDLIDCPASVILPEEAVEKSEEGDEREKLHAELRTANLICLCISLVKADSIPSFFNDFVPHLRNLTSKPVMLIGTNKEKRDSTSGSGDAQTVLGSDSLKSLMVSISRESMISPKRGQEFMEDIQAAAYVEISADQFQGFRTLANTGLAVTFGEGAKTLSGQALSDKMRKRVDSKDPSSTAKDEKCVLM